MELIEFGYKESKKKPNLFYKIIDEKIILFFDFRSEYRFDHSSYFQVLDKLSDQEKKKYTKIIYDEFYKVVKKLKIYVNFLSEAVCNGCEKSILEPFAFVGNSSFNKIFNGEDEEMIELSFCSEDCFKKFERDNAKAHLNYIMDVFRRREGLKCPICKKIPKFEKGLSLEDVNRHLHHTDYNEDKTILLCPSCHAKITFHLDKYPELKKYKSIGTRV